MIRLLAYLGLNNVFEIRKVRWLILTEVVALCRIILESITKNLLLLWILLIYSLH